jgi:hypothetical protein
MLELQIFQCGFLFSAQFNSVLVRYLSGLLFFNERLVETGIFQEQVFFVDSLIKTNMTNELLKSGIFE